MPPILALFLCCVFIAWLLWNDLRSRKDVSRAIWIPFFWAFIIGSKPLCLWIGYGTGDQIEGTPIDRMNFMLLIAMGVYVLWQRGLNLNAFVASNKMLLLLCAYWAVSIMWSDYPFVSFKRWIKDMGNVVMILVVLTEVNPLSAAKALFLRLGFVLIPLSITFVKYFPEWGRMTHQWTWENMYVGATLHKNSLGSMVLVCGLFVFWQLLGLMGKWRTAWRETAGLAALLLMGAWLLYMANSATSTLCAVIGAGILLLMNLRAAQGRLHVVAGTVVAGFGTLAVLDALFGIRKWLIVDLLGRDMTLTTRTELWKMVLEQDFSRIFGTGFYSFWMGDRIENIWEVFEGLNQAHNGYIETYLNGGAIGVTLLAFCILAAYVGIHRDLRSGSEMAKIRFVFWVVAIVYNLTEATFNRLGLTWMLFLLSAIDLSPVFSWKTQSEAASTWEVLEQDEETPAPARSA